MKRKTLPIFSHAVIKKNAFYVIFFIFLFANLQAQDYKTFKLKGDEFWKNRDITDILIKAIETYKKAEELAVNKIEKKKILGKISYGYYLLGDSMKSAKERKTAFYNGYIAAEKILEINPNDPEANYFHVINKLSYKDACGMLYVILYLKEFNRRMNIIMSQNKYVLSGGPQRVLARMIHLTPYLFRNRYSVGTLNDAEKMLNESINIEPQLGLTRVFLADIYLDMGKDNFAKEELIKAINCPVNNDICEFAPENRLSKKIAKNMMYKYFHIK